MTPAEFGKVGELIASINRLQIELAHAMDEVSDLMSEIATTQDQLQALQETWEAK